MRLVTDFQSSIGHIFSDLSDFLGKGFSSKEQERDTLTALQMMRIFQVLLHAAGN